MTRPGPTPPVIAEAARAALERIIASGAKAILILHEDGTRKIGLETVPDLECVRQGLLKLAFDKHATPLI